MCLVTLEYVSNEVREKGFMHSVQLDKVCKYLQK